MLRKAEHRGGPQSGEAVTRRVYDIEKLDLGTHSAKKSNLIYNLIYDLIYDLMHVVHFHLVANLGAQPTHLSFGPAMSARMLSISSAVVWTPTTI